MNQNSNREMLDLQDEKKKIVFPRSFISNSFFKYFVAFMSSSRVPTRFKSSTYTSIIANSVSGFLIKMHGHIGYLHTLLLINTRYDDCTTCVRIAFNPYRDRCNLIKYILRDFVLFASSNLIPSGIFIFMSLSMDPYR